MANTPIKNATSVVTVRAFCRPMLRSAILTLLFQVRGRNVTYQTEERKADEEAAVMAE